jgi:hypothetical protein
MPRCKNCKEKYEPIRFNHKYCLKDECIKVFVEETKKAMWMSKKTKMVNALKTLSDYRREAQTAFNSYIRKRDEGKPCVSCNAPLLGKYDAGHYFSVGGHEALRFDERNVHGQCVTCNQYKHGNLIFYRHGLLARIGETELVDLESKANVPVKRTKEELENITKEYKKKLKEFK